MARSDLLFQAPPGKPFFCFAFDRWQAQPCGCKGCAKRTINKQASRG